MGIFGPPKIKVSPRDFVKTQLDEIFSDHFRQAEADEFTRLSQQNSILKQVRLDDYLRERQNVIYNLFHIVWCRTIPETVFIEHSSSMADDPRVEEINSGVYDMALSKAQEAGMDTFGYFSSVFLGQILPQGVDTRQLDFKALYVIFGTDLTSRYISYEALIKRHRFDCS